MITKLGLSAKDSDFQFCPMPQSFSPISSSHKHLAINYSLKGGGELALITMPCIFPPNNASGRKEGY